MEITKREVLASISIVAIMLLIGILISERITDSVADQNAEYNKAIKIESTELFQHGMDTDVGNAFVYGNLEAADTVTYPEIGGKYIFVEKIEERYEKHEREVTVEDAEGKEHTEIEEYYKWDTESTDSLHAKEIKFCNITFPYSKIDLPNPDYIKTIKGNKVYSWKSGEKVKTRFLYYGIKTRYEGTIYTTLGDKTIADHTQFYDKYTIDETVKVLETYCAISTILFWATWIILVGAMVYGFYYLDNRWLK